MRKMIKAIRASIEDDNVHDVKQCYKYYDIGPKTLINEMTQLEYAIEEKSFNCINFFINDSEHNILSKTTTVERAIYRKLPAKIIKDIIENTLGNEPLINTAKECCYRCQEYKTLLALTEILNLSYNYFELKALGFPEDKWVLAEKGAKYKPVDYYHALLRKGLTKEIKNFFNSNISYILTKDSNGNIAHTLWSIVKSYPMYYDVHDLSNAVGDIFLAFDINLTQKDNNGIPGYYAVLAPHYNYFKVLIDKYGANEFAQHFINSNEALDLLIENNLSNNLKIDGHSLFEYSLIKKSYRSLQSLYNFSPDFQIFINETNIIELAMKAKDEFTVGDMINKGIGYNSDDFDKMGNFVLLDAVRYSKGDLKISNKYYGLVIIDFIRHFKNRDSKLLQYIIGYFGENGYDLSIYDEKYLYIESYFKNPEITIVISLQMLIDHGASVKYGNPLRALIVNKNKLPNFLKDFDIIIKQGLFIERIDCTCGLIDDIVNCIQRRHLFAKEFMKAINSKKTRNLQLYDEKVKFFDIWVQNPKIETLKNYEYLKKSGASPHYIDDIKPLFVAKDVYRSMVLNDVLLSFIEHGQELPPLEKDEHYLTMALESESMYCISPNVIHSLLELGVNPKPIENKLIFILIDKFVFSLEIYQALLDNGINIDVITDDGETPLIYLLKNIGICDQRLELAKFFLKNGINMKVKDIKGYTALSIAKIEKDKDMIQLLET